ncbi:MAG: Glu/Leu/Phe/Val dehydrogenase [Acidobacteria bacterium]|nr:MAG: Glu/Leu/Phe/Val dehydrogenase [Acidobacteriota bacterium]
MDSLHEWSCAALAERMREAGIVRAWLAHDPERGRYAASHPLLEPLARWIERDAPDFAGHEAVFLQVGPRSGVLEGAFVHRTCRGQAAGGVRFWDYDSVAAFLTDGLRLARGMTHKNALAGLWWGGGKGVMARNSSPHGADPALRATIYEEYGRLVTAIRGCYVTAEDVGTSVDDMAAVFRTTRFTTCIPPRLGGSGNPSVPTALGVVCGMEAALEHLGLGSLAGRSVALQGLGHVGEPLARFLLERGVARIVGADLDARAVERVAALDPARVTARRVGPGDASVLFEDVDIVAPCATGAVLGPDTIPRIRARVVCGAANNQLADPERDDALLDERGVLYMPDFLVNRMGIVQCADEDVGTLPHDPRIERHLDRDDENGIFRLSLRILDTARAEGRTPHRVALELAERRSREPHPLWGHRGLDIVRAVMRHGFADTGDGAPGAPAG